MNYKDFEVKTLGKPTVISPLNQSQRAFSPSHKFIDDADRILYDVSIKGFEDYKTKGEIPLSFEKAGPREFIYFEPAKTKVAIVTCGGLCPGVNNVIRSIVNELHFRYGINRVIGIQYGYEGFISKYNHPVIDLNPDIVRSIHLSGGTFLGSSRGEQDVEQIVNTLEILNVNLFILYWR